MDAAHGVLVVVGALAAGFALGLKFGKPRAELPPAVFGARRSSRWPSVRAAHLRLNPRCAACSDDREVVVHHIVPVHVDNSLELVESNLISLCEGPMNCHFRLGHLGNFSSFNASIEEDAAAFLTKVSSRP